MREVIGSVYDYRCGKDLNMFGQVIGFLYRPDTDKEEKTEWGGVLWKEVTWRGQ